MGDALAGSLFPSSGNVSDFSWNQALEYFAEKNTYSRSILLTPPNVKLVELLPQNPFKKSDMISYVEQLDFALRRQYYEKTLVLLGNLDYKLPFMHQDWVNFILNTPYECRRNRYIYHKILLKAYPKLFSLPVKNNKGLPLNAKTWQLPPQSIAWAMRSLFEKTLSRWIYQTPLGTNYVDFNEGLRRRADLKGLVDSLLQDLIDREIIDWIDIADIWYKHTQRKTNYADALTLLVSLEVNMKVRKI